MPDHDLLESFRAGAAPVAPDVRARSRAGLLAEIERGPAHRIRRRALVLVPLLAIAVLIAVLQPWHTGGDDATARAAAYLAPVPGRVVHVRMVGHRIVTPFSETWTAPDGTWRSQFGGTRQSGAQCTIEDGFDMRTHQVETWDASARRIDVSTPSPRISRYYRSPDPVTQIRGWLAQGSLRAAGHARVDGRDVIRLVPKHGKTFRGTMAYDVDARTYAPVRYQVNARQWYDITVYERLPATAASLALASVRARHAGAPLVRGTGSGGCGAA